MKLPCTMFALTLTLAGSASASAAPCANFMIQSVESLTVQEIGQLADPLVQSAGQYTAVLRVFDPENRPHRRDMQAAAFLLVGKGDIGEVPVGALIWSTGPVALKLEALPTRGFKIIGERDGEPCSPMALEIQIVADGTVLADKQELGKVR